MKFTFACKKITLNDSIKEYAEKKISKLDKYFPQEADAFVTFAVEKKNRCVVELTIRTANGTLFRAQEEDPDKVTITRDISGDFVVSGKSLDKLVAMTNFGNDEALRRFQYIWRIKGLDKKLRERGIKEGDTVHVGAMEFEYRD